MNALIGHPHVPGPVAYDASQALENRFGDAVAADGEKIRGNIESAIRRRWPEFPRKPAHKGTLLICAQGPSIRENLLKIKFNASKKDHFTWAVNKSPGMLELALVRVDFACLLDPREWVADYIKPTSKTVYFVASQCSPKTLDVFEKPGVTKFLYHHQMEKNMDLMKDSVCRVPPLSTTVGMESIFLGHHLGFRKFQLYGFDSCYQGDVLHASPKPHELLNYVPIQDAQTGKLYHCNSNMARQAGEFKHFLEEWDQMAATGYSDPIDIAVYGRGLIPDIADFYSKTMKWVRHVR